MSTVFGSNSAWKQVQEKAIMLISSRLSAEETYLNHRTWLICGRQSPSFYNKNKQMERYSRYVMLTMPNTSTLTEVMLRWSALVSLWKRKTAPEESTKILCASSSSVSEYCSLILFLIKTGYLKMPYKNVVESARKCWFHFFFF